MGVNLFLSTPEREKLEHAVVGIAGAGGLGSNCAAHLVRSGVRKLVVADFDAVSAGNLNRQFFFADQLGRKKVDALRENLLRIDPELELVMHDVELTAVNAPEIFRTCDVVIEALDRASAKMMLIRTMLREGKKVVAASGIAGWGRSGRIGLVQAGEHLYLAGDGESAAEGGDGAYPVSPRVGIVAAMEANTVIALILGVEV